MDVSQWLVAMLSLSIGPLSLGSTRIVNNVSVTSLALFCCLLVLTHGSLTLLAAKGLLESWTLESDESKSRQKNVG